MKRIIEKGYLMLTALFVAIMLTFLQFSVLMYAGLSTIENVLPYLFAAPIIITGTIITNIYPNVYSTGLDSILTLVTGAIINWIIVYLLINYILNKRVLRNK